MSRDQLDEIVGLPIGWSTHALFDEQGAPFVPFTIGVPRVDLTATGVIRGGSGDDARDPSLTLRDAEVSGIELDLTTHGALLSCGLAWKAAGDEVDDIADLLGKLCGFRVSLVDGGQRDLLTPLARMAAADGIESIEIQDGDGNTIVKVPGRRKRREAVAP